MLDARAAEEKRRCDAPPGRRHEATKIAMQVIDALDDDHHLHRRDLVAGTVTEIGAGDTLNLRAPGQDGGPELPQIRPAPLQGRRAVPQKGGTLPLEDLTGIAI
jgi:hypothetical protein